MKAIQFVKHNFLGIVLAGAVLFLFSPNVFAEGEAAGNNASLLKQLLDVHKKLDESKKREEEILASQKIILEEILTSRKWAKRK